MLDTALELDTGRYSPAQSPLILYVFRLVVRVEGFLLFLKDERRCRRTRGLRREDRWVTEHITLRGAESCGAKGLPAILLMSKCTYTTQPARYWFEGKWVMGNQCWFVFKAD